MRLHRRRRRRCINPEIIRPSSDLEAFSLADLQPGQSGEITAVLAVGSIRHRLLDLGFRRGEQVQMVRQAPLKDPLEFRLNSGHISLRRAEASLIKVREVG